MNVLVVEDEPGIASFVKQGLEEEGFAVTVAEDGKKGLEFALSGRHDLLLLDWMLPGMNGIEICREVRKKFPELPIIFLTAKDTVEETIFALKLGANDYIKKPFHFAELLERVRVQLRSFSKENKALQVGDLELDLNTRKVYTGTKEIQLTQKEFDLLAFLMLHKGNVCKRTDIIEQVWDIHFEYNTGVIDVYINALRKKLDLGNDRDYIHTVRGVGYSISTS
ncbi:MAG: response regulator transcription factor [Leeuwenhoekiella sp.]